MCHLNILFYADLFILCRILSSTTVWEWFLIATSHISRRNTDVSVSSFRPFLFCLALRHFLFAEENLRVSATRVYVEYNRVFSRDDGHTKPSSDTPYRPKGDIALARSSTRPDKASAVAATPPIVRRQVDGIKQAQHIWTNSVPALGFRFQEFPCQLFPGALSLHYHRRSSAHRAAE